MANNRQRYAPTVTATAVGPLLGTKLEWLGYVEQLEAAGVSTNRWIEYLRHRGFITPSSAGAELMRLVRSFGYCTAVTGGVEKLRKEPGLSAVDKKHVRAVWSVVVTMRSRYDAKTGAVKAAPAPAAAAPAPAPAAGAPAAGAPAAGAPAAGAPAAGAPAAGAPAGAPAPALPAVDGQCLTVDRQALQQILNMLESGEIKEAINTLETMLS